MFDPEVLIVGGGLAGLCCARRLQEAGISSRIFEASDDVGGRARTDEADGFLLDRGFQVLLTAYPEAQRVFDYSDLRLSCFEPGALIRYQGRFHRFADPWRRPKHFLATARSPVASLFDNLCVPSQVTPTYAPENQSLISVTTLGVPDDDEDLESIVLEQLRDWFGADVNQWRHLRTYRIPYALPSQEPPALSPVAKPAKRGDGTFVCGDYLDTASIQGAMMSGRRAAEQIIELKKS